MATEPRKPRLPLARAYRPQTFAEVLGQQAAVRALGTAARRGDLASAYIFSGTRGIGKTTLARLFAKALNCETGPAEDCCATCTSCEEIAEGRSIDVLELDAATHTGIDDIRELREAAQYPPARSRYRVFILDEAHQLSASAWNGLLKILEEPPPWCVFLFCTTEAHKIPQTIESRSLHFSFKSPTPSQIRDHLKRIAGEESLEVDDDAIDLLVRAADGSVRDGLSALDQVRALASGRIDAESVREALGLVPGEAVHAYVSSLASGDAGEALAIVERLADEGQDLRAFAASALERVRELAIARVLDPRAQGEAAQAASAFRPEQLIWIGRVLDESERRLRAGGPHRTLLDLATIRMVVMADLSDLGRLARTLERGGGGGAPSGGTGGPRRGAPAGRPSSAGAGPPPHRARDAAPAAPDPGQPHQAVAEPRDPEVSPRAVAAGTLHDSLAATISSVRPHLGAYLARLEGARVDDAGDLVLALPGDRRPVWADRLETENARHLLAEVVQDVTGRPMRALRLELNGAAGTNEASAAAPAPSRQEVLDRARRDPLVRAIFDRFGAVLLDGVSLEDGSRPGAAGDDEP